MQRKQTEPYLSTYLHAKGRRLGLPVAGNFELTARCNFDCPMCYVHKKQADAEAVGRELTAAQWIHLAEEAKDRGMVFVLLTGGEPFVRKDFFEIYDAMKAMGLLISINTNGSMLSGEIRRRLLENPPARMNISLYGGCRETYRSMCGQDAFDQVLENIRALKEGGIDVSINLSITRYNLQDLERISHIAEELNIPVRASSYMYPSVRVNGQQFGCTDRLDPVEAARASVRWDLLRFSREEFALRAQNIRNLAGVERECPLEAEEGVRCRAGSTAFWVTWDGKMLPCGMLMEPVVDPLLNGFQPAWEQLKQATAAIRMPAQCSGCSKKDVCAVCAAVCVTETGRFDGVPEYVCRMTEAIVTETWNAYCERNGEEHGN